ncbi:MAG: TPR repeat protein [Gammaproteobacteria bacterium]|jgi:TPR repeat protein
MARGLLGPSHDVAAVRKRSAAVQPSPPARLWRRLACVIALCAASLFSLQGVAVGAALAALEQGRVEDALKRLRALAETHDAGAMAVLGDVYYFGWGVEASFDTARIWYKAAAKLEHAGGHHGLGRLHLYGQGVKKDVNAALYHLNTAGEAGHWDMHAETMGPLCLPLATNLAKADRALHIYFKYGRRLVPGSFQQINALRFAFPCD